MQNRFGVVVFVLIMSISVTLPAAGSFGYNFDSGEEIRYQNIFKISSTMETNNLIVGSELELFGELTQVIREVGEDNFSFAVIFDSLETRDFKQTMTTKNSSDRSYPINQKDEFQGVLDSILGRELLSFLIDGKGNLLEKEVQEELRNFRHVNLSSLGQQIFISFPQEELEIGTTWESKQEFTLPQGGNIRSINTNVKYTVLDRVEEEGIDCYKIEARIDYWGATPLGEEAKNKVEVKHSGLGYLYYSPELGRLVRSVTSQNYKVQVYMDQGEKNPIIESVLEIRMDNSIKLIQEE